MVSAAEALLDLMDQLEGLGIYLSGNEEGQWHGTEGLSFRKAAEVVASLKGMSRELTEDQRTRLVEKLVADQVEGANRVSLYLWDVLENGFKGYANYTDQELLDAHWGAFDEGFFDPEPEDDGDLLDKEAPNEQ